MVNLDWQYTFTLFRLDRDQIDSFFVVVVVSKSIHEFIIRSLGVGIGLGLFVLGLAALFPFTGRSGIFNDSPALQALLLFSIAKIRLERRLLLVSKSVC